MKNLIEDIVTTNDLLTQITRDYQKNLESLELKISEILSCDVNEIWIRFHIDKAGKYCVIITPPRADSKKSLTGDVMFTYDVNELRWSKALTRNNPLNNAAINTLVLEYLNGDFLND